MSLFVRWAPCLLASALACAPPPTAVESVAATELVAATERVEIPHPDLSTMKDSARRRLESLRREAEASTGSAPAEQAQRLGALGRAYMAYTFPRAAEACFANAQRLADGAPDWPYYLGVLRQERGELAAAVDGFERASALAPALATLVRLGQARLALGLSDAATTAFEQVLALDPSSAAALHGLGQAAAAGGDLEVAARYFEQALDQLPEDSVVHHSLGQAYRRMGRLDDARSHLERQAERPVTFADPLIDKVSRVVQRTAVEVVVDLAADPAVEDADFMGFALSKLGEVEGAGDELERALEQTATDDRHDRQAMARLHHVTGVLLAESGAAGRAARHLRAAIELEPELAAAVLRLGDVLAGAGEYRPALEQYEHVLRLEPENREAQLKRATALVDLGRFTEALPDLRHLVEHDPADGGAQLRLATALQGLGEDALSHWRAALELDLPDREQAFAWFNLANTLGRQGRFDEAVAAYRSALELEPESTGAWLNLASLLDHLGRRDEAAAARVRLRELKP